MWCFICNRKIEWIVTQLGHGQEGGYWDAVKLRDNLYMCEHCIQFIKQGSRKEEDNEQANPHT
jgi:hypothetical protein